MEEPAARVDAPHEQGEGLGQTPAGKLCQCTASSGPGLSEFWKKYRQPGVVGSWNWFSSLDSSKDCICFLQKCS